MILKLNVPELKTLKSNRPASSEECFIFRKLEYHDESN